MVDRNWEKIIAQGAKKTSNNGEPETLTSQTVESIESGPLSEREKMFGLTPEEYDRLSKIIPALPGVDPNINDLAMLNKAKSFIKGKLKEWLNAPWQTKDEASKSKTSLVTLYEEQLEHINNAITFIEMPN